MESREDDCPFCRITNNETDTEILLSVSNTLLTNETDKHELLDIPDSTSVSEQDDQLVCFRDLKPGAAHHYLIVPRRHIDTCKSLQADDVPLVEQMQQMGMKMLEKNKVCDLDDVRLGFHLPPFSSVPHLHLHALAPASQMVFRSQLHYGPKSHWFITVDKVLSQLKTQGRVK
ncbi:histidine triad nucleotide-binding protein 3-like [Solea senegalensis]|uniref:Histidine triad nucleotide-binding protein 3-like n=1 Tax=Solea senegalensis TaxID=28829 RepID=A0AAV6RVK0_SOLSE|nr:histidine triad nucleotide-binding protein 3-like isoform X1 [Solea senegalensis]KAG7509421.1 histidine triad nucleotide-binding protein 3-like [Solea senegalensis]